MIDALSLEPPVSEEPFLRRELGLRWVTVSSDDLATRLRSGRQVVLCSEPEPYRDLLSTAQAGSVVLVMISDEAYTTDRLDLVRQGPAVRSVFRQYGLDTASPGAVAAALAGFARDSRGTDLSAGSALDLLRQGRATRARMRAWSTAGVPISAVPLGYTSQFEAAFAIRHGVHDPEASLLDVEPDQDERPVPLTFRGVRGTAARAMAVTRAEEDVPGADLRIIEAGWSGAAGGDVGRSYVEALEAARLALCPPGFANGETFRYCEALTCGALPIEAGPALTHLGRPAFRPEEPPASWRAALTAVNLDEPERRRRVASARTLVRDRLTALRRQLVADLEG